jgi:hypothetical protein
MRAVSHTTSSIHNSVEELDGDTVVSKEQAYAQ